MILNHKKRNKKFAKQYEKQFDKKKQIGRKFSPALAINFGLALIIITANNKSYLDLYKP